MDPCRSFAGCVIHFYRPLEKSELQGQKNNSKTGIDKVAQTTGFLKTIVQVLIQPIIRMAFEFRQLILRMRESSLQFLIRTNENIKGLLKRPGAMLKKGFERIQQLFLKLKRNSSSK